MPTLSEYEKLALDEMHQGVIEELITANTLMGMLQFESISGNSLLYDRENTHGAATTHQVGDTWTDTEPTYTQKSAGLAIVGVQHPLDRFAAQTRSNVHDQKAETIARMTRSLGRRIQQLIITGEPEATTTEFEGLDSLVRSETRMMAMDDGNVDGPGTAETELTLDRLDAMMDQVNDGQEPPDALVMNTTMRRKLTALSRVAGSGVVMSEIDMFGKKVRLYDGVPILLNNWITNAEQYNDSSTWPSSTATTIFAVNFGKEREGYTVLHNGEVLTPDVQDIGIKEAANENLYRIAVYIQAITYSSKQVSALGGIDSAS